MNMINDEKDMRIEEQAATNRLLTDLTEAGSWAINYAQDGSVRWFRSKGMLSRDAEGRPLQYRGVTIDITQAKEHDALYTELQNEAASLNTIHEMLGSGKWTMDFDEAGVDTFVPKPLFADNVMEEFREAFRRKNKTPVHQTADLKGRRILLAEDVANAHLSKPVEPEALYETLEKLIRT